MFPYPADVRKERSIRNEGIPLASPEGKLPSYKANLDTCRDTSCDHIWDQEIQAPVQTKNAVKGERDLTQGGIISTLISFAIPFFAANLLQALYGAVDLLIVGRFATGVSDVSAVACGSQIMTLVILGACGLTTAGTVIIGNFFGSGDMGKVRQTIGTMLSTFGICSVFGTVLMCLVSPWLLKFLHTPEKAFVAANQYVLICSAGTIFIFGYNAFSAILRGVGNSVSPMIFVGIACLANIVLDLVLVGKFGMGPAGAAIATVGSQAVSMVFAIFYIRGMKTLFDFKPRSFAVNTSIMEKLFCIGLPLSIQSTLIDLSFIIIFSIINKLGVEASAGYGICCRLNGFTMLPSISFSMALTAIVAQNLGAGKTKRALSFLKRSILLSVGIASFLFLWMEFWPKTAFAIFTKDPGTIAAGSLYMKSFCFDVLMVAFVFSGNGFLNGSGHTRFTLVNNVVPTFLVRIPVAWFIANLPNATLYGIGWAAPLASFLSIVITLVYLKTGRWKIKRI